jgi:hypothetical protein
VVDGTQSVGALPIDVQKYRIDALVCGGYKWLMGPYSLGVAYLSEYFDDGIPLEESWMNRRGSDDFQRLVAYEPQYRPGAARYDVGEHSNFILLPMLTAALRQILAWEPAQIPGVLPPTDGAAGGLPGGARVLDRRRRLAGRTPAGRPAAGRHRLTYAPGAAGRPPGAGVGTGRFDPGVAAPLQRAAGRGGPAGSAGFGERITETGGRQTGGFEPQ